MNNAWRQRRDLFVAHAEINILQSEQLQGHGARAAGKKQLFVHGRVAKNKNFIIK